MTIEVQGERYRSAQELRETIAELEEQLGQIGEGTPEHRDLALHVARLEQALADYLDGNGAEAQPAAQPEAQTTASTDEDSAGDTDAEAEEAGEASDGDVFPCPLCDGAGTLAVEPPASTQHLRCPSCDGWGEVLTGSRLPDSFRAVCPDCEGRGWRNVLAAPLVDESRRELAAAHYRQTGELPEWARGPGG